MKTNSKSIRLTDKVYNYIINYNGSGFNEKFENIILYAMESEEKRRRNLESIDKELAAKRAELLRLDREILKMKGLTSDLKEIIFKMDRLRELVECQEAG